MIVVCYMLFDWVIVANDRAGFEGPIRYNTIVKFVLNNKTTTVATLEEL